VSRFTLIKKLVIQHKSQLLLTYLLFSLEMLGSLMRPYFLGEAVNDLIKGSYRGLIILSVIHLLWIVVGVLRHRYDTRTYSAIYTSLVTRFLTRKIQQSDVSKLTAHATLAREFIDFLEYDLVYIVEAGYNLIGSIILLYFYEWRVVGICLGILIPVMLVSYSYGKKMKVLNQAKNDELENQVDVISEGDEKAINLHFFNLRKWQVRISDQDAWNFGIMELMVLVVITFSLHITHITSGPTLLAGSLIGIYNYILKFVAGLDTIPYTVQRISSLSDITRRIELQAEDLEKEASKIAMQNDFLEEET
jgi:ABC-type multidrug transport system fused ATPase/permease subunit